MKELYCLPCSKYRKCEKLKISCILEKVFKDEEQIETLKISGLVESI